MQEALDTLAGGLLILDTKEQIVLANKTIARALRTTPEQLQGQPVGKLPWMIQSETEDESENILPWTRVLTDGETHKGITLSLEKQYDCR